MKQQPAIFKQVLRQQLGRPDFWWATLATVLLCSLAARLCLWQLDRVEQKQQMQTQLARMSERAAWDNGGLLSGQQSRQQPQPSIGMAAELQQLAAGLPDARWLYQPVHLQGQWLPEQTIYLENRPMQGRTGFWVYMPFALADSEKVIWVQRGWVARDARARNRVPPLRIPTGLALLHGQLQGQPSALASLGEGVEEHTTTGAALRLNMDWAAMQAAGAGRALPYTVREREAGQGDGLGRNWDAPPMGIAKHQGYAFQWAAMGAVLLLLYLWFQCWRPYRSAFNLRGEAKAESGAV